MAVAQIADGCAQQGDAVGLDSEWESPLGGATPKPVSTAQLSLPDGTAFLFHFQRGARRTTKRNFPNALRDFLEDPSIAKVRKTFTVSFVIDALSCYGDRRRFLYLCRPSCVVPLLPFFRSAWTSTRTLFHGIICNRCSELLRR